MNNYLIRGELAETECGLKLRIQSGGCLEVEWENRVVSVSFDERDDVIHIYAETRSSAVYPTLQVKGQDCRLHSPERGYIEFEVIGEEE